MISPPSPIWRGLEGLRRCSDSASEELATAKSKAWWIGSGDANALSLCASNLRSRARFTGDDLGVAQLCIVDVLENGERPCNPIPEGCDGIAGTNKEPRWFADRQVLGNYWEMLPLAIISQIKDPVSLALGF